MPKIPSRDEYRQRWSQLDTEDRRAIVKSVNRGTALDDRAHAAMGVRLARNQKRFWSRAWLLGPIASLLTFGQGVDVYIANALLASVTLGGMSWFWWRRADRAERQNLAKVTGRSVDEVESEAGRGPLSMIREALPSFGRSSRSADGSSENEPATPPVEHPTGPVKGPGRPTRRQRKR